jgi:AAA domain
MLSRVARIEQILCRLWVATAMRAMHSLTVHPVPHVLGPVSYMLGPRVCMLQGLACTLFERLHALWGESVSEMLTVQYRMNAAIMEWSSRELYGGRVTAHASVATHSLQGLTVCTDNPVPTR